MRTYERLVACLICFLGAAAAAQFTQQVDFTGTYHMSGPTGTLTVTLRQVGDEVTGKLVDDAGDTMLVEGEVDGGEFSGIANFNGMELEVFAELRGRDTLLWTFEIQEGQGQEFTLQRVRDQESKPAPKPAGVNPLGGGPPKKSPFAGSFEKADGSLKLVVRQTGAGFEGTLTVRDATGAATDYPLSLSATRRGLAGTFGSGADSFPIALRLDDPSGKLVVTSGDFVHRLDRVGGGNPLAGPAGKPDPGAYRHPLGWYTFKLPEGWRVLIEESTSMILDAGKPGVFIFALSGHLEADEVGRPVPAVFQEALPDLDAILAQGMNIQADSNPARATALTPSHHPAADASWAGALQTYDGPQHVKIWSGTAFDDDYFVLMLAVINPDEFQGLLPQLRGALAATRVLQAPTPAELEQAAVASAQPTEDPLAGARDQAAQYSRRVTVNGTQIDDATLGALEQGMGIQIPDNDYWYDPICGAVGGIGGPGVAFFPAGLNLGGPLRADASGGGSGLVTGVFVNGRELHPQDVEGLKSITGMVVPGRYWVDSQGNFGLEGGPLAGNLLLIARTRQTQGGGSEAWTRYKDFGGTDGKTHFGSFGDGDFYFSGAGGEWWPGK